MPLMYVEDLPLWASYITTRGFVCRARLPQISWSTLIPFKPTSNHRRKAGRAHYLCRWSQRTTNSKTIIMTSCSFLVIIYKRTSNIFDTAQATISTSKLSAWNNDKLQNQCRRQRCCHLSNATESIQHWCIHRVSKKNCAKLFLSQVRQKSTKFDNFWHTNSTEDRFMWGAHIFHLT